MRDFRTGLLAAYVDLCKAFDSTNRNVLWRILALLEIPSKLANLISFPYSSTENAARCDGTNSDYFPVNNGVRQGSVLASVRNTYVMDYGGSGSVRIGQTDLNRLMLVYFSHYDTISTIRVQ